MHQDSILLATFVVALVAAFLGGILARMVRLPPVVGYLLGGLAVGPFTPGFIGDSHAMSQLAEVGVMFMMFGTGLHCSFDDLMTVRGVAVPGALLQTALGTLAGCGVGLALGWPLEAGVMLGLSVSIASTVVLIKNLADAGLAGTDGGRIATGWLIVEDLLTVVDLFSAVPDTNLRWMTVPANGVAAGSTLADLQLRAKTGAQAVALRRDDEIEFAIEADMPLCAGDILGLAGSEAQIEATLALLGNGRG